MKMCDVCGRRFRKGDVTIARRVASHPRLTMDPRPMCPQWADKEAKKASL